MEILINLADVGDHLVPSVMVVVVAKKFSFPDGETVASVILRYHNIAPPDELAGYPGITG
jgi:hypothetical protein